MDRRTLTRLLDEPEEERQRTATTMLQLLRERYGEPPYVVQTLADQRPDLAIAQTLRLLGRARNLEPRVAELVAVAAAAALRCEWCIRSHLERAVQEGASNEEIFETLTIAAAIAESSTQAVAFREFQATTTRAGARPGRRRRAPAPERPPERPEERPARGRRRVVQPVQPAVRSFPSREAFWEALVERFQAAVPQARLSRSTNPYWRAVRLGRGGLQLTWAFRRRGNLAVQLLLNGRGGGHDEQEAIRAAVGEILGQDATLEAERGRRSAVAVYYPVRGAGMSEEAVDWGVDAAARLYRVLSLIEGRRRRRGRRPRGPAPETAEGRLLAALQPYLPGQRATAGTNSHE